jgi:O-antigen/teichoic acid export membrane protein
MRRDLQIKKGIAGVPFEGIFLAVIDQALISGANFLTIILLARTVSIMELGVFSLIFSVGSLISSIQSTLITQPLLILGVAHHGSEFTAYLAASFRLQFVATSITTAIIAIIGLLLLTLADSPIAEMLLIALPFFVTSQLQEFARRALFAEDRIGAVFLNDLVSYGGRSIALFILITWGQLTSQIALVAAAATFTLGILMAYVQTKALHHRPLSVRSISLENWQFGKWLFLGEIIQALSVRLNFYLTVSILGTAAAGIFQAVSQITNVLNVFMYALVSILMPRFGRIFNEYGAKKLHHATIIWIIITMICASMLLCFTFVAPGKTLNILYTGRYNGYENLLMAQSAVTLMWVPTYTLLVSLRVHRANWVFPIFTSANIATMATIGLYLLVKYGLTGIMIASGISAVLSTAFLAGAYWRTDIRARQMPEDRVARTGLGDVGDRPLS